MKTLTKIIILGILSLSLLGHVQADERLLPQEQAELRLGIPLILEMLILSEIFEDYMKDPVELEEIYESLRQSKKSARRIETLDDARDSLKELSEYFAVLLELEGPGDDPEWEETERKIFALMHRALRDAARATSYKDIAHILFYSKEFKEAAEWLNGGF